MAYLKLNLLLLYYYILMGHAQYSTLQDALFSVVKDVKPCVYLVLASCSLASLLHRCQLIRKSEF